MKLEERYISFKLTDLNNFSEAKELCRISESYANLRKAQGKGVLKGLFIEKDWPEYKPTLNMLTERVHGIIRTSKRKHNHYYKDVSSLSEVDVYRLCSLFDIKDPSGAIQHAIKKLVLSGQRGGGKDFRKDLQEAIDTLTRKLEMLDEDNV